MVLFERKILKSFFWKAFELLIPFQIRAECKCILKIFSKKNLNLPQTIDENISQQNAPKISFFKLLLTFEYMRLNGKLIAIDRIHTKIILRITRRRVLFLPKRNGKRSDKYLSTEIVDKCIMLAVQKSTSRQIHTRQCSECSGKYPGTKFIALWKRNCSDLHAERGKMVKNALHKY